MVRRQGFGGLQPNHGTPLSGICAPSDLARTLVGHFADGANQAPRARFRRRPVVPPIFPAPAREMGPSAHRPGQREIWPSRHRQVISGQPGTTRWRHMVIRRPPPPTRLRKICSVSWPATGHGTQRPPAPHKPPPWAAMPTRHVFRRFRDRGIPGQNIVTLLKRITRHDVELLQLSHQLRETLPHQKG